MLHFITLIDSYLQGLVGPFAAIITWALFSAIFSMFLYKLVSPQAKLQALKIKHKDTRNTLIRHDGDFAELQSLIIKDLSLSLKQVGLILPAFIISVIPVFALMFCLFTLYAYALPETGDRITLTFHPQANSQEISWPSASAPVTISDDAGTPLFSLPLPAAIPEITKPSWLTTLFPNPIGVLPENALVESVQFSIPGRHYVSIGPEWMRGFEFWYIITLLAASIFIKIRFRII